MRRNKHHATVASEHNISGHYHDMADPRRSVNAHHRGVQKPAGPQRSVMVRGIVCANESNEVGQFVKAVNVAHRAVINYAVSRFGIDRVSDIVADGRPTLFQSEMITGIDIAIYAKSGNGIVYD